MSEPRQLPAPTIGRLVHYMHKFEGRLMELPAIIVCCLGADRVDLQVFTNGTASGNYDAEGTMRRPDVKHDEEHKRERTWHWPERS